MVLEQMGKFTGKTLDSIVQGLDRVKHKFEPGVDKFLFWTAVNSGMFYGVAELIERSDYSSTTNGIIMWALGGTQLTANYLGWGSDNLRKLKRGVSSLNYKIDRNRAASWIKSGTLAGAITLSVMRLDPYLQQLKEDFFPITAAPSLEDEVPTPSKPIISTLSKNRPSYYDKIGYSKKVDRDSDFNGITLADKYSTEGRIQRTLRWQPIYHAVEKAHGLPEDTLAGMIMQESCGDPLQPNSGNDGGLGITHVQGRTGWEWGMKIHGSSNSYRDTEHGKELRAMLETCNYDPACAVQYDERAHLIKVLDTAARIVRRGYEIHNSWDLGVEFYHGPGWVGKNRGWRYLKSVKKWIKEIRDIGEIDEAREDFEKRNPGKSFDKYINQFHETAINWQLPEYVKLVQR